MDNDRKPPRKKRVRGLPLGDGRLILQRPDAGAGFGLGARARRCMLLCQDATPCAHRGQAIYRGAEEEEWVTLVYATELIIGDHTYVLPRGTGDDVLEQLTEAVRAGGGVVELPVISGSFRAVLISPGVPVFIERIPIPDDPVDAVDSEVEDPLAGDWTY